MFVFLGLLVSTWFFSSRYLTHPLINCWPNFSPFKNNFSLESSLLSYYQITEIILWRRLASKFNQEFSTEPFLLVWRHLYTPPPQPNKCFHSYEKLPILTHVDQTKNIAGGRAGPDCQGRLSVTFGDDARSQSLCDPFLWQECKVIVKQKQICTFLLLLSWLGT